jgi:adenylate kinase family enzyme
MDGNYSGTLDLRLASCDTVIFLDLPRLLCLRRVLQRMISYRNTQRPDMSEGCPERVSLEFISWVWNYSRRTRPKVLAKLEKISSSKRVVRLRSDAEVETFLTRAKTEAGN